VGVVIPVYNEEGTVETLHSRLKDVLDRIPGDHEIIFVNDGSTDSTLKKLEKIVDKDKTVSILNFHRNFGKANALQAGFDNVKGDIIITMDGDLQDDPMEIPRFISKINSGYDLVSGWKKERKDPISKKIPSKLFNGLIKLSTGLGIHDNNCGFKAYRKKVVDTLEIYGEFHRYIPIMAHWRGFRVGEMVVKHHPRSMGRSKYGMERLWKGSLDLLTIILLVRYGRSPMYLAAKMAVVSWISSILVIGYEIFDLVTNKTSLDRPLTVLAVILLISGFFFFFTGISMEHLLSSVGSSKISKSHYEKI
jgi:glycosyltransferase involved in cell wall biosynthesis